MGAAAKYLRHHLRRRRLLPPPFSPPFALQNPNSLSYSNPFNGYRLPGFSRRPSNPYPNSHPFSSGASCRSFSWSAWTGASENRGGGDSAEEISEIGSDLSSTDGSGGGPDVSNLGTDELGVVEELSGEMAWYDPVNTVISLLDGFHDLTGLPWWLLIFISTLALRAALLPVLILQLKKVGKIAVLFPKLPPPLPPLLSGRSYREQYLLFQKKRREIGCPSYLWSFASFAVQFPCFLLWMTSIRRMCLNHHPGFDSGGTLWFQNLTDIPHDILGSTFPLLVAGLHYTNVQISFQTFKVENLRGILGLLAKYYKLYLDVLAIPLLCIGFHIPQGSLVYWVTNSSLTLIQQLSLRSVYIRNKLGLPDEMALKNKSSKANAIMQGDTGSLQHAISAEALPPEKLLDLAVEDIAAGRHDEAYSLLRLATEKDPELVRALIAMGQILCSKELFLEAAELFERAISKIQNEEESLLILAYFGAGVSRIWQGRKSEGVQHLRRIADLKEPDAPMDKACYYRGLVMLGSTLFGDGKKSEAAKYLRMAAAYDPAVNAYVKECEEE